MRDIVSPFDGKSPFGGSGTIPVRQISAPFITPSVGLASGVTATANSGTFDGAGAAAPLWRWGAYDGNSFALISGAINKTYFIQTAEQTKQLYFEQGVTDNKGRVRWFRSALVSVAGAAPYLLDGQWDAFEATTDKISPVTAANFLAADTRKTVFRTLKANVPNDKRPRIYRGTSQATLTLANTALAVDYGDGYWSWVSGGQAPLQAPGILNEHQVRVAFVDLADGTSNFALASDWKKFQVSSIPYGFDDANDLLNGQILVGPGAAEGSITVSIPSMPNNGGQPLSAVRLYIDGSTTAKTLATSGPVSYTYGSPTDWAAEVDPLNPVVDHTFDLELTNANGTTTKARFSSRVKEAVVSASAPTVTVTYDSLSNEIRINSDQRGEVALMIELPATDRNGSYVQTNLTSAPAYLPWTAIGEGETVIAGSNITGFALLATNTYSIKPAVRNSENTLSGTVAAASMPVTGAPAGSPASLLGGFALGLAGSTNTTTSHSISALGTLAAGDLVLVIQANSGVGNLDLTCSGNNSGAYTEITDLFADGSGHDTNFSVHWAIMGTTPDTTVAISGSADANRRRAIGAIAFRATNAAPIGNTATTTATATTNGQPPAIGLTIDNWIVGIVGGAANVTSLYTAPGEYGANFWTAIFAGTLSDAVIGFGARLATATGTYTPAAFTGGDTSAGGSCVSASIEIKKV